VPEKERTVPMALATAVTICLVKVREHEKEKRRMIARWGCNLHVHAGTDPLNLFN